ncbi:MAG TPA: SDR family oxidoreductase [Pyrinomonadaceae bacterium]|nr:SDR family oxidoreductase [Pyrinomonadaceae bacterium]
MGFDETVFLTGFPGFIAGRLLEHLAKDRGRFLLLVQPQLLERAHRELEQLAHETKKPLSDFHILEGDITQTNLGLSPTDLELARSQSTTVFHLAAIYDLAVARETAIKVNVGGTRNVNEFARTIPNIRRYNYVSTCYVAGKRDGPILETELRHDAGFRNFYEESKYLAEVEVDALKSELPITIHRPSVVCGDSVTGETAKYDGVYYLIQYLRKWPGLLRLLNIGNNQVTLNLVPVDFVVEAMATLAKDESAVGKTFQLADPNPLTTHELFDTIGRCLTGKGSRITVPASLVEGSLMLPFSPAISGLPHHAVAYFFLKQTYDTAQARELLEPRGVRCPPFASYAGTIVEYVNRHPIL